MDSMTHLEMQIGMARATEALKEERRNNPQSWLAGYYAGRLSVYRAMLGIPETEEAAQ